MDPLSLIASVTAVLQLTATVVNYLNDVKNASNDQRRFAIEASSLFSLLTGLKYRIEDANLADPWFTRARALAVENGPLSQYKVALERLVTKTIPGNESKKIFADFLWPLRKGEVAEIFATIERLKSLTSIALEMDHFKLSQAINEETKKMPELIANVDVVRRNQEDQESQIIMDWLSATDFSNQQTDLSLKRQEGTGTWFLEMQEFNYWLNGTNTILFCRGDPGTGKTMLSSLVIDHIRNTDNHQLAGVAFLYCDYKKQKEQKPVELLSALLRQLLQGLPLVPNTVKDLYDKHIWKKTRPSLDGILTTIQSILGSYPEVFIIIDALDECADEQRDILLSRLKTLQVPTVKLMITSRRNVGISAEFPNPFIVEIKAHNEDIVRFIQGQIPRLRCVSSRQDLQQHIISTIKDAADGLFILTVLLFESLVGKTTPKAIKLALESMPKGSRALSQAYSDAIERIESQQPGYVILAKEALSWITCARRQLSVKELQHALAVEIGEDQLDEENITDISVIVSVCAGLVTVDEQSNIVRLVHYTAYEHFIKSGPSIFPAAHRHIAMICINYLMFETFEAGSCLYQEQFEARLDSHALYDYAARNWGHHARTDSMTQEKLILTFLESKAKVSASVQAIFSRSANWRKPDQVTGMHLAAYFGLKDAMIGLLKLGQDLYPEDSWGRTPLFYAGMTGQVEIVRQLLATHSICPERRDESGQTLLSCAASLGQEEVVKLLLLREDVDPGSVSNIQQTPLSYAAENGHEAVVKLLLARDTESLILRSDDSDYVMTPLLKAAQRGHVDVVKLLLADDRFDPNFRDIGGRKPLSYASRNYAGVVKLLLAEGVDPDIKTFAGETPLFSATGSGQEAIVQLLLGTKQVDLDSKNMQGWTPLSNAAKKGHDAIVKLLVSNGANRNSTNDEGRTPLSHAAAEGHDTIVKFLLDTGGIDMDHRDKNGRTPLSWATAAAQSWPPTKYNSTMTILLGQPGVDPNTEDSQGRTPFSYAAEKSGHEMIRLLLSDNRIKPDSRDAGGRTPFSYAMQNYNYEVVKLLLSEDRVDPDSRDARGRTPLSHAAEKGPDKTIQLLLSDDRIDPDSSDADGRTPLSYAAETRAEDVLALLLMKASIDLDSKDHSGRTPLSYCAEKGQIPTAKKFLMQECINPESKDAYERTPLFYAVEGGHIEMVRLLLSNDRISPDPTTVNNQTVSSWTAEKWYKNIVRVLTQKDGNFLDERGKHSRRREEDDEYDSIYFGVLELIFAEKSIGTFPEDKRSEISSSAPIINWHEMVVRLLFANEQRHIKGKVCEGQIWHDRMRSLLANDDVDPDFRDVFGRTLLWWIASSGYETIARFLLAEKGVNPEARDEDGRSPLSCAAMNGNEMIVSLLLARDDVDPKSKDIEGRTPLSLAAEYGNDTVVKLLLAKDGVDPDIGDVHGSTPIWFALEKGHPVVVELLLARQGADRASGYGWNAAALLIAAQFGHEAVVNMLLEKPWADPNATTQNEYGQTPFLLAAVGGHHRVVHLLLMKDSVDPDPKDKLNQTPL